MRLVARRARDRPVLQDCPILALSPRVTIDTGRRLRRRCEAMTPEAARLVARLPSMPPEDFLRVAVRASCGAWILESLARQVVAAAALDMGIVHVGHVPRPQTNLRPGGRDVRRDRWRPPRPPREKSHYGERHERKRAEPHAHGPSARHGPTP